MSNINGIIVVNKPQNWTSHDCVAFMRKHIGIKRIGHTGTLDPMATGVLPVCVGTATRIMEYLDLDYKTYMCSMKLGVTTDTEDIWGSIISKNSIDCITREEVEKVLYTFTGEISQTPPKYSALKVNGKKLYEYARKGIDVDIKSRNIFIKSIELKGFENDEIEFVVTCSKGTYIRTICKDIGEKLGCGGTMTSLVRTSSGNFKIEEALDIEEIKKMDREAVLMKLLPTDYPLTHFGKIKLTKKDTKDLVNGKLLSKEKAQKIADSLYKEMYNIYYENEFIGVAQMGDNGLKAHKIFNVRMQNENF